MQEKIFYIDTNTRPPSELTVQIADTFFKRLRGLMFRSQESFPLGRGLLIAPCNSIHMMFMRFPIDVVYIDENYHVLKVVGNLPAWRGLSWCLARNCWGVVELPVGSITHYGLTVGSKFVLKK